MREVPSTLTDRDEGEEIVCGILKYAGRMQSPFGTIYLEIEVVHEYE